MNILLNGEARRIEASTLAGALIELGYEGATVATAVNGTFVAAHARAETRLDDQDRIEVLAPMQGG